MCGPHPLTNVFVPYHLSPIFKSLSRIHINYSSDIYLDYKIVSYTKINLLLQFNNNPILRLQGIFMKVHNICKLLWLSNLDRRYIYLVLASSADTLDRILPACEGENIHKGWCLLIWHSPIGSGVCLRGMIGYFW